MAMNSVRFKSVYGNMTAAAQKVYTAIPAQDEWDHDAIHREMRRLGLHMDFRTMQGCINSLCGAGLVRESRPGGKFARTEVRGKGSKVPQEDYQEVQIEDREPRGEPTMATKNAPTTMAADPPPQLPKNPVDMLGDLAAKARNLSAQLNSLALEIDSAALAAQDYVEQSDKSTEKLRQLQTLLKSLS